MEAGGIAPISVLAVNLYPFRETVAKGLGEQEILENIDIGGPAMIRAGAKNAASVTVVVDPEDYAAGAGGAAARRGTSAETRRRLQRKAYAHTAAYDASIAGWMAERDGAPFPTSWRSGSGRCRSSATGRTRTSGGPGTAGTASRPGPRSRFAEVLQGKELSYNNLLDLDAALALALEFPERPAAVIIKHNTPCGVAQDEVLEKAYRVARAVDEVSAFGGIVAFNREVDEPTARAMAETFLEAVIAPGYSEARADGARGRRRTCGCSMPGRRGPPGARPFASFELRSISGGLLVQDRDAVEPSTEWKVVTRRAPTDAELAALRFGWRVCKHVKSNAIVFSTADRLLAVGGGQTSRVESVKIAAARGGESLRGSAVASDAFFPFRDGLDALAQAGAQGGGPARRQRPRRRGHRRRRRARRGDGLHRGAALPALTPATGRCASAVNSAAPSTRSRTRPSPGRRGGAARGASTPRLLRAAGASRSPPRPGARARSAGWTLTTRAPSEQTPEPRRRSCSESWSGRRTASSISSWAGATSSSTTSRRPAERSPVSQPAPADPAGAAPGLHLGAPRLERASGRDRGGGGTRPAPSAAQADEWPETERSDPWRRTPLPPAQPLSHAATAPPETRPPSPSAPPPPPRPGLARGSRHAPPTTPRPWPGRSDAAADRLHRRGDPRRGSPPSPAAACGGKLVDADDCRQRRLRRLPGPHRRGARAEPRPPPAATPGRPRSRASSLGPGRARLAPSHAAGAAAAGLSGHARAGPSRPVWVLLGLLGVAATPCPARLWYLRVRPDPADLQAVADVHAPPGEEAGAGRGPKLPEGLETRLGSWKAPAEPRPVADLLVAAGQADLARDTEASDLAAERTLETALVQDPRNAEALGLWMEAIGRGRGKQLARERARGAAAAGRERARADGRAAAPPGRAGDPSAGARRRAQDVERARSLGHSAVDAHPPASSARPGRLAAAGQREVLAGVGHAGAARPGRGLRQLVGRARALAAAGGARSGIRRSGGSSTCAPRRTRPRGSPRAATADLQARLAVDPDEPRTARALARLWAQVGETAQARKHLRAASGEPRHAGRAGGDRDGRAPGRRRARAGGGA